MPIDAVQMETLLGWAVGVIAFLVTTLFGLLAFIFMLLKKDVSEIGPQLQELLARLAHLVHKDECRTDMRAIRQHMDEVDAQMDEFNTRLSRIEGCRKFGE